MQADGHHLGRAFLTLAIENVETVFQIGEELVAGIKALWRGETHVVCVQRIGHDQVRAFRAFYPIGQFVGIGIGGIEEAAFLHHQLQRVVGGLALIDAERARAGNFRVEAHGLADMFALDLLRHVFVFPPSQAMAGDFPAGFFHGGHGFRVARHGKRHPIDGDGHIAAGKGAPQAPEAGTGAYS